METIVHYLPHAFAVFGFGVVVYWLWGHVITPVASGSAGLVTAASTDFAGIESRLTALEVALGFKAAPVATGASGTTGTTGTAAAPAHKTA